MPALGSKLRRSAISASPVLIAILMGLVLGVSSALSYRDASNATVLVAERQGVGFLHRVERLIGHKAPRADEMHGVLEANHALGLRYIAVREHGAIVAEAGEPLLADTHPSMGAPAFGQGRVRMLGPAHLGGPPGGHGPFGAGALPPPWDRDRPSPPGDGPGIPAGPAALPDPDFSVARPPLADRPAAFAGYQLNPPHELIVEFEPLGSDAARPRAPAGAPDDRSAGLRAVGHEQRRPGQPGGAAGAGRRRDRAPAHRPPRRSRARGLGGGRAAARAGADQPAGDRARGHARGDAGRGAGAPRGRCPGVHRSRSRPGRTDVRARAHLRAVPHHQAAGHWPRPAGGEANRRAAPGAHRRRRRRGWRRPVPGVHSADQRGDMSASDTVNARLLVVDDEEGVRTFLADALSDAGHAVSQAADGEAALALLGKSSFHVVLTDLRMPGVDGMALLQTIRRESPDTEVIVLTAHGSIENAVEAMKHGAFD